MKAEVANQLDELEAITTTMDIPEFRRRKVDWLSRNMGIRNSEHPRYNEAKEIVKSLMKQGVR